MSRLVPYPLWTLLLMWAISGCFSDETLQRDARVDQSPTTETIAVTEQGVEGGTDFLADGATERGVDTGSDMPRDGGADAAREVGPDTIADLAPDATVDLDPDATVDHGPDWRLQIIGGDAGAVTTVAGGGLAGSANGPGPAATFDNPVNAALDENGDLYITDFNNGMVRKVTLAGDVSTVVDQPNFKRPFGIALMPDGELYVQTDYNDLGILDDGRTGTIWRIDRAQQHAVVVQRDLGRPRGLAALSGTFLAMADDHHHVVQVLDLSNNDVLLLAGTHDLRGFVNGVGADALFNQPYGIDRLPDGRLAVADYGNHAIRAVAITGAVTTLAGDGIAGWADGPAAQARFYQPQGLTVDAAGNIYVSQRDMGVIRRLSAGGQVTTLAGDGSQGFADHATDPLQARFYGAEGMTVLFNGSLLFVADGNGGEPLPYHRIRRVVLGGDPCAGVSCGGHGSCVVVGDQPSCSCELYYRPDGIRCVPACEGVVCPDGEACIPGHHGATDPLCVASCDCENCGNCGLADLAGGTPAYCGSPAGPPAALACTQGCSTGKLCIPAGSPDFPVGFGVCWTEGGCVGL